jgi:hypothetical protein
MGRESSAPSRAAFLEDHLKGRCVKCARAAARGLALSYQDGLTINKLALGLLCAPGRLVRDAINQVISEGYVRSTRHPEKFTAGQTSVGFINPPVIYHYAPS